VIVPAVPVSLQVFCDLLRRDHGRLLGSAVLFAYVVGLDLVEQRKSGPGAPAYPSFAVTTGLTADAVRTGAPALSNDVSRDPQYLANQSDSGSELIVPILADGRVAGTLDVESDRIGAFGGSSILDYERLAEALRPPWDQPIQA